MINRKEKRMTKKPNHEEPVTDEHVEAWVGRAERKHLIELITWIANNEYSPEKLKKDIMYVHRVNELSTRKATEKILKKLERRKA